MIRAGLLLLALASAGLGAPPTVTAQGAGWLVRCEAGRLEFAANGSLAGAYAAGQQQALWRSGDDGLWSLQFADRSVLTAAAAGPASISAASDRLRLSWAAPAAAVTVTVTPRSDGADLTAQVTANQQTALTLTLPGRLRFDAATVDRLLFPEDGNQGVGLALNRRFFGRQPADQPTAWRYQSVGPAGYQALYGGPLKQLADRPPEVRLKVPADGETWLGGALAQRLRQTAATVNRPPATGQWDLLLVDSSDGPWLSAKTLGAGRVWRLGGAVDRDLAPLAAQSITAVVRRLVAQASGQRRRVALLALDNGPVAGSWCAVRVNDWRAALSGVAAGRYVELRSTTALAAALAADEHLVMVNPYGEAMATVPGGDMLETVRQIGAYVRRGGQWVEVGGYPFHYALAPVSYLTRTASYPPAFADFLRLETTHGAAAVYGVQPHPSRPWQRDHLFVPGYLACGGDERGGWCERSFGTSIARGQTWSSPAVRLRLGGQPADSLTDYAAANGISRRLEQKVKPAVLERLRQSVLLYYGGTAREKTAGLDKLPKPTLIHFADYLKGGFDKEYPDHLPPNRHFGTMAEMKTFFDRSHELGHLVMPYTNPTWWCDGPKGPTFEKHGDAPLLRRLDGQVQREQYAQNTGFAICFWHPAVQAANRLTIKQFTQDLPVDVLFQDQCGARTWHYDSNPASPTPYAYAAGMVSMVDEDSQTVPLSTESGWDRVVNAETQLCGLSWLHVPTEGGPEWRQFLRDTLSPSTWQVFPLAQYLAHDKTAMLYHDLGQFVTTRRVATWTLGLGFQMSMRCSANGVDRPNVRDWLSWVDRLQKSVCGRYLGQPVTRFDHQQAARPSADDDGLITAAYGPIEIVANLGPRPVKAGERELAGYGFRVSGPDLVAANLQTIGDQDYGEEGLHYVAEATRSTAELWVWAPAQSEVTVELPRPLSGRWQVQFDGQPPAPVTGGRYLKVALPAGDIKRAAPPAELRERAPKDWPGGAPSIGVIDLGAPYAVSWSSIQPADWTQTLGAAGLPVRRLTTFADLTAALDAGPTRWLAVVNPYGETFPCAGPGQGQAMLGRIHSYVNRGGSWFETAGYSFYRGLGTGGADPLGPAGLDRLGLTLVSGAVEAPPEPLTVTPTGRAWLGDELAQQIESRLSPVNRGLSRGAGDPGHIALVAGSEADYIGGYRLDGWGFLWRIGGFNPNPEVALPVVAATLRYLHSHPPVPVTGNRQRRLWHARVTR